MHFQIILSVQILLDFAKISLQFIPYDPINYMPALVHTMHCRWTKDKPLFELLITDEYIARPPLVNSL